MTKRSRKPRVLNTADWISLRGAFMRIKASVGPHELAEDDLHQDLMTRLPSAMRMISYDGSDTTELLERSFWQHPDIAFRMPYDSYMDFRWYDANLPIPSGVKYCYFFVHRPSLDKFYPVASAAPPSSAQPTRRKPGKQTTRDWPLHVARELGRIEGAGKKVPTAAKLAQFCEDTLGYEPDIREVQKILKLLLG
jgi:hypothetical protein